MQITFPAELEARLIEAAARDERPTEDFVRDLIQRYFEEDTRFRLAVERGFASLDRGEFLDESAMEERVRRILRC